MHFGIVFSVKDELYMPLVMPLSCELPNWVLEQSQCFIRSLWSETHISWKLVPVEKKGKTHNASNFISSSWLYVTSLLQSCELVSHGGRAHGTRRPPERNLCRAHL